MTDRLSKARAKEAKLLSKIADLRDRIARRERRGVADSKPQAADAASVARYTMMLQRMPDEIARAVAADKKDRRKAAFLASMMPKLDALKAGAPSVQKRWEIERAREPKRLKKRKAELTKRVTKDYGPSGSPTPEWRQKPVPLPPPVEQPVIEEDPSELTPPRRGLIPGTWKPNPGFRPLLDRDPLPSRWTARHVGQRLIDAYATLRAMPERDKPKGYSALWPAYRHEAGELAIQAGAGTIQGNRIRRTASADEVALMDQALGWVSSYCSHFRAVDRQWLIVWCDDPDSDIDADTAPTEFFQFIADALNAANEVVR